MKSIGQGIPSWMCLLVLSLLVGCQSKNKTESNQRIAAEKATHDTSEAGSSALAKTEAPAATKPFQLGDLVLPFTPPPLAELDKTAGWVDRPVLSGIDILRKKQQAAGPPTVSIKEALALRNDSAPTNKKILEAMGRLAPPDGKGVDYNAVIVRHVGGDMKSSNPLLQSTVTEAEFQGLTGIALITNDADINYFAPRELIVSWQSSKDHLMDKFVLRDDLEWSDGQPITAKDVEYSFKAIMTEAVPVLAVRTGTDQLKWVQAYDDHTIVIFHKQALATNTVNMEFPIIPQHVFEKQLPNDPTMARSEFFRKLEDHPVVGGPYELVKRVRNQEFVVRRSDNYYMHEGKQVRPKPYFREVRVKAIEDFNTALLALKAGQIDEMELRAEQWISQTNGDDFYGATQKSQRSNGLSFILIGTASRRFSPISASGRRCRGPSTTTSF